MLLFTNIRVAARSLWKHKLPSLINIVGLTTGLCSCLLIAMYIQHQVSFDRFQPNGKRIARAIMEYSFDGSPEPKRGNFTSTKVAPVFSRTFPEILAGVRMYSGDATIRFEDRFFSEPNFFYSDSTFFEVFAFNMIEGNPQTALDGPRKVVLTKSTARKYFGTTSPVGKILLVDTGEEPFEVTGVVEDYPATSQLRFDFLASFSSLGANQEETYFNANYTTFFLLTDENAFEPLQAKVTPFMKKEMEGSGASINFLMERFNDIHLRSPYGSFVPTVSEEFLLILAGVALLILVIVCATYINLSTARAVERAREVGVRKVAGAGRGQLFWQFVGESTVISVVAIVISMAAVAAVLPSFNQLIQQELMLSSLLSLPLIGFILAVIVVVSLLAGSYPAIVLSRFQPVKVLKGNFKNMSAGKAMQQFLLVFQFSVTLFLIVATFVITAQLDLIRKGDLGYDREHIIVLPMDRKILADLPALKNTLKSDHHIVNVSRCVNTPVNIVGGYGMRSAEMASDAVMAVNANPVDDEYIPAAGLDLIAGANFTPQDLLDVAPAEGKDPLYHFILNERAARQLGWTPEDAIGKKMFLGEGRPGIVRGVIKDFHFQSMHEQINPLILFPELRGHGQLLVKVTGDDLTQTLSFIESTWRELVPYLPFEYRFLDEDFEKLYRSELRLGVVMKIFSGLAILLACLGLFGLSAFIGQQRMKEMSIRKVLGASIFDIMTLLSQKFVLLFVIAIAISIPLAYFVMGHWLNGFAYRVDMSPWLFIAGGAVVVGVSLLTVSIQAVKTAMVNPAKTLKSE